MNVPKKAKKKEQPIMLATFQIDGKSHEVTLAGAFRESAMTLLEQDQDPFTILHTLVLACVLVEALVKHKLKKINPALILLDLENIAWVALVSGKKRKLLNQDGSTVQADVRTAPFAKLLKRLEYFENISRYRDGLMSLFKVRNQLVHAADECCLDEQKVLIYITKYAFPYLQEDVPVSEKLWGNLTQLAGVAGNRFKAALMRKIVAYRKSADAMLPEDRERALSAAVPLLKEEVRGGERLKCPACGYLATEHIIGVDVDSADGEVFLYPYSFTQCSVCGMRLESAEYDEIIDDGGSYLAELSGDDTWYLAIRRPQESLASMLDQ